jgi:hypothetical protein
MLESNVSQRRRRWGVKRASMAMACGAHWNRRNPIIVSEGASNGVGQHSLTASPVGVCLLDEEVTAKQR